MRIRATPSGEAGMSLRACLACWTAHSDGPLEESACEGCPFQSRRRWVKTIHRRPELFARGIPPTMGRTGLRGDDSVAGSGRRTNGVECALWHGVEINCVNRPRRVVTAAAAAQTSLGHARQTVSSSALMQLVDTVCSPPRLRGWMSGRTSSALSVDRSSGVRKARIHPNSYDI